MTHYMGLLADHQPWNLIFFMAIPVIFAETIAITELYLLYTQKQEGKAKVLSRYAGIFIGLYMVGVFVYLVRTAVIPLTTSGGWRGIIDIVAVGGYLLSAIPLMGIGAIELGILPKMKSDAQRQKLHTIFVAIFLVLAHVAMIFGMMNPSLFGWSPALTPDMGNMIM